MKVQMINSIFLFLIFKKILKICLLKKVNQIKILLMNQLNNKKWRQSLQLLLVHLLKVVIVFN